MLSSLILYCIWICQINHPLHLNLTISEHIWDMLYSSYWNIFYRDDRRKQTGVFTVREVWMKKMSLCLLSRKYSDLQQKWPAFYLTVNFVVNDSWRCSTGKKNCCLRWPWPSFVGLSFFLLMAWHCGRRQCSTYAFVLSHTRKCHDSCLHQFTD